MKKLFNLFFLAAIINSGAVSVRAQDSSTCFMLDERGNQINLGSLCQKSSPKRQSDSYRDRNYHPNNYADPYNNRRLGVYSVPIKRKRSGIPVIDVNFNNSHTFEMMLDTGASRTTITKEMAKKLGVKHYQTVWVSTPSDNAVPMSAGFVYSLEVANISQDNPLVITSPNMDMGLLGQSFFGRFDITIEQDTVEFRPR